MQITAILDIEQCNKGIAELKIVYGSTPNLYHQFLASGIKFIAHLYSDIQLVRD